MMALKKINSAFPLVWFFNKDIMLCYAMELLKFYCYYLVAILFPRLASSLFSHLLKKLVNFILLRHVHLKPTLKHFNMSIKFKFKD